MLTPRQVQLLEYIHQRQKNDGITPSYEEMREALGLRSKSGIHQLITGLIERGYLSRMANRSRALEILRLPSNIAPSEATPMSSNDHETNERAGLSLPFLGKIAAGLAIEAIERNDEQIAVPEHLVGKGTHFVLEIEGDSMIEAGILDGDQVIIRHQQTANNGDIVVACIDREDVTLKRLQRRGSSVALQPENAQYQTQIYSVDRVEIKGVLAGLIRQY